MAEYQLTATDAQVIGTADQAYIPNDPLNADWRTYQEWLAAGGVPDPHVAPPTPAPTVDDPVQDVVLYDHENRLRFIEGKPMLSFDEFRQTVLKKK